MPSVVQSTTQVFDTQATTFEVTTLGGMTTGNLLVIEFTSDGSQVITMTADLDGQLANVNQGTVSSRVGYKEITGSEPASYTITVPSAERGSAIVYEISDAEAVATQPPEQTTDTGASSAPTPVIITPTGGSKDYLFLAFTGVDRDIIDGWPSNMDGTNLSADTTNANGASSGADSQEATASTFTPNAFAIANDGWTVHTVAIHPAGAPAPSSSSSTTVAAGLTSTNSTARPNISSSDTNGSQLTSINSTTRSGSSSLSAASAIASIGGMNQVTSISLSAASKVQSAVQKGGINSSVISGSLISTLVNLTSRSNTSEITSSQALTSLVQSSRSNSTQSTVTPISTVITQANRSNNSQVSSVIKITGEGNQPVLLSSSTSLSVALIIKSIHSTQRSNGSSLSGGMVQTSDHSTQRSNDIQTTAGITLTSTTSTGVASVSSSQLTGSSKLTVIAVTHRSGGSSVTGSSTVNNITLKVANSNLSISGGGRLSTVTTINHSVTISIPQGVIITNDNNTARLGLTALAANGNVRSQGADTSNKVIAKTTLKGMNKTTILKAGSNDTSLKSVA